MGVRVTGVELFGYFYFTKPILSIHTLFLCLDAYYTNICMFVYVGGCHWDGLGNGVFRYSCSNCYAILMCSRKCALVTYITCLLCFCTRKSTYQVQYDILVMFADSRRMAQDLSKTLSNYNIENHMLQAHVTVRSYNSAVNSLFFLQWTKSELLHALPINTRLHIVDLVSSHLSLSPSTNHPTYPLSWSTC